MKHICRYIPVFLTLFSSSRISAGLQKVMDVNSPSGFNSLGFLDAAGTLSNDDDDAERAAPWLAYEASRLQQQPISWESVM